MQPKGRKETTPAGADLAVMPAVTGDCLARFCLGVPSAAPGDLPTDLAWLAGDTKEECWQTADTVHRGQGQDALSWSAGGGLLVASVSLPAAKGMDLAEPTRAAYRRLLRFIRDCGYPALLRLWNYIPAINDGAGDAERYRRFCVGRNIGLEESGVAEAELCAATAVGTHGERLIIHALAGQAAGKPVENPRQVSAYKYPRAYGPRSPSFARATALDLIGGSHALLVSGTASIVGHRTVHRDDPCAQIDETLLNLETLLDTAADRLANPGLARFGQSSQLRVYLRDRAWTSTVAERIGDRWPAARIAILEADICRRDLAVEIEAFHRA